MCVPGRARSLALVAVAAVAGCATASPAPPTWQRSVTEFQTSPFGSWANVTLTTGRVVSGELIAADDQSIHLGAHPALITLPGRCVQSVRIAAFEADGTGAIILGIAGTASTITHGFFLIISAPIWLATTINAGAGVGKAGYETLSFRPGTPMRSAGTWARFPPGLPVGFAERAAERQTLDAACASVAVRPPAPPPEPPPTTPAVPVTPVTP